MRARLINRTRVHSLTLTLLLGTATGAAGQQLQQKAVLGGRMLIAIPATFEQMSNAMLRAKYPSERRPTLVYTNPDGTVNIAINQTNTVVPQGGVAALHQAVSSTFKKLYPSAMWYRSEVLPISGREWFLVDLRTPAIDTEVRNVMIGTAVNGRMLAVSFNVTKELEAEWLATGYQIVQSVVVK